MNFLKSRLILCALFAGILAGCAQTPPPRSFPDLRYSHLPPIAMTVGDIEIVEQYVSPRRSPNVEHQFPVKPAAAAAQWVRDRLQAAGGEARLRATILDGRVVEVPLKRTTGVRGVFTTDQSERYDGTLEVRLEIVSPAGRRQAMVSSKATRTRTVPENVTLAEREDIWFRITESMMNDLNAALEKQIRQHLANWVR